MLINQKAEIEINGIFEYAADCPSGVAVRTIYEMVQKE